MTSLHDWHREVFCKRTPTTLVFPAYSTIHGGNFPETRSEVTLASARSVIVQRAVNALSPDEWKVALEAFDASPEGQAFKSTDASERREHCALWLLHTLHETEHEDLVSVTELALQKVLDHHAKPEKVHAHKARLVAHCGKTRKPAPLAPDDAPVIVAPKGGKS